jgi:hypothetical protein
MVLLAQPYSKYTHAYYFARLNVSAGDELFTNYGITWFQNRPEEHIPLLIPSDLSTKNGICLSDVYVHKSTIPSAGRGVFARRKFRAGQIITVSPVLFLDATVMLRTMQTTVLANYCVGGTNAKVWILPIGSAAMMNHRKGSPNVAFTWFDWNSMTDPDLTSDMKIEQIRKGSKRWKQITDVRRKLATPLGDLIQSDYAPLDFIYYALTDIEEGEELFLDYGADWDDKFRQYQTFVEAHPNQLAPFRHAIEPPSGLFPSKWYFTQEDFEEAMKEAQKSKREKESKRTSKVKQESRSKSNEKENNTKNKKKESTKQRHDDL